MSLSLGIGLGLTHKQVDSLYGPELVTNGTFDADVAGWLNVTTAVISWNALGYGDVTSISSNNGSYRTLTTEIGKTYRAIGTSEVASIFHRLRVGNGAIPDAGLGDSTSVNSPSFHEVFFEATGTTSYVYLRNSAVGTVSWDNISVKEVL